MPAPERPMAAHEHPIALALRALNSELAGSNRVVAARIGLNESDLAVLDLLHREGPQTPTALARRTRMGLTTMTSVLRRLVRNGWVERRLNETDLRSFTIHPTSVERLSAIFRPANEEFAELLTGRPAGEASAVLNFLQDATAVIRRRTDELAERPRSEEAP